MGSTTSWLSDCTIERYADDVGIVVDVLRWKHKSFRTLLLKTEQRRSTEQKTKLSLKKITTSRPGLLKSVLSDQGLRQTVT